MNFQTRISTTSVDSNPQLSYPLNPSLNFKNKKELDLLTTQNKVSNLLTNNAEEFTQSAFDLEPLAISVANKVCETYYNKKKSSPESFSHLSAVSTIKALVDDKPMIKPLVERVCDIYKNNTSFATLALDKNRFRVCTYNMGARVDDYLQLCKHQNPALSFKSKKEEDSFIAQYHTTQNKVAELLKNKAEVYCLQEVVDTERPLIQSLKTKGFEIIHDNKNPYFDNAIALDKSRFKNIVNHSITVPITDTFKKDVAIATAIDIFTKKRVTFVSAHVPGFDFTKEMVSSSDTIEGDIYCRAIAKKLSKIASGNIQIIGADMNANPEKWYSRFNIFTHKGFEIHRTHHHTNVNPKDSVHQEREIDFIFTKSKSSIWQKIKSIFRSTYEYKTSIIAEKTVGWEIHDNASDHIPVFSEVSSEVKESKLSQIGHKICKLFARTQHAKSA